MTPIRKSSTDRLLDARSAQDEQDAAIQLYGDKARDMRFLHVVLAQCGLPYKNPGNVPLYVRKNGTTSLALTAGTLMDPKTDEPTMQGLPYGPKPRLLMLHLCSEAIRNQSAEVEVGSSMSALMHDLGLAVTGGERGSIRSFKEQLNRLAASRMQFFSKVEDGYKMKNPAPVIEGFDVWFATDPKQKVLWPTRLKLSDPFFESLRESALPVDLHAVRALQASSMKLDIYTWLAHRLCRVPGNKPSVISWEALKQQFGQDSANSAEGRAHFKSKFRDALAAVKTVYREANVTETTDGRLELRESKPPIPKIIEGKTSTKQV